MGPRRKMAAKSRPHSKLWDVQSSPSPAERWLAIDLEINQLSQKWATLETQMARNFGWFGLSATERHALPQASLLYAIEGQLDRLSDERERQLESLAQLGATDLNEAANKLAVALRILDDEEGPAYNLVSDAVNAIAKRCCPNCGTPYLADTANGN